jgi:hypothetical protein
MRSSREGRSPPRSHAGSERRAGTTQPEDRHVRPRILVFLHGTVTMHFGAIGHTREERVRQARDTTDPTVRSHATYVPIGRAADKPRCWAAQGAQIDYLSPNRGAERLAEDQTILHRNDFPPGRLLARAAGESYGELIAKDPPDLLLEDDCERNGADEVAYPQIPADQQARILSLVVPEFAGPDHRPDSLSELLRLSHQ